MAKKITAEIHEHMKKLHNKGLNNREIGDLFHVDASTVSRWLREKYGQGGDSKEVSKLAEPGGQMELVQYCEPDPEKIQEIVEETVRAVIKEKLPDIVRDEIRNATISIQFNF